MDPALQQLLESTVARVDGERGLRAWLRCRPTRLRWLIALTVAAVVPLMVALASRRPDVGVYPGFRMALEIAALALAAGGMLVVALWPMQRAPARGRQLALMLAAVVLPILASLPAAHHADPRSLAGAGDDLFARAAGCFAYAVVTALPAALAARLLRRDASGSTAVELAFAFGAALVGGLAVYLHCPIVHGVHIWLGHVPVLVPFVAWAAVVALRLRCRP